MTEKLYLVWEQVGLKGIDKTLVPIENINSFPVKNKIAIRLPNNHYEYIDSKKVFKVDNQTGKVIE